MIASTIAPNPLEGLVLHAHDAVADAFRHQPLGAKFLAAKADHHHLAAEIRIEREILQRADRHNGLGCGDRDAAAIGMGQRDHVVDVGIFRQQLGTDFLDRVLQRSGDALHRGRDAEDVLGAHRTVGIAKTFECIAFERRQLWRHGGCDFQRIERRRFRHANARLIDPLAGADG